MLKWTEATVLGLLWLALLAAPLAWNAGAVSAAHRAAAVWVVAGSLPSLAWALALPRLKWWLGPDGLAPLNALLLVLVPLLLPPLAGLVNGSWAVFGLAALAEIPPAALMWRLLGRFNEAPSEVAWIEHVLRRKARPFPGLSVGIVRQGELVYAQGFGVADRAGGRPATPATLYRIGSVTKVFTTTLLAVLRDTGRVRLDDPVTKYLPRDVRLPHDPRGAPDITLRHLATHSSGLPRLPVNPTPKGDDPYGGYPADALYTGLARTRLLFPPGAGESYSNLGVGLLGLALSRAAGKSYEELLRRHLLDPLGMTRTSLTLSDSQRESLATGYLPDDPEKVTPDWDMGCLAPAGGLVSSVEDLAKFLALQLRAGEADAGPVAGGTLTELHTPQRLTDDWEGAIGLGWHVRRDASLGHPVWHNGGLAGFTSLVAFSPRYRVGVVVLANSGREVDPVGWWLLREAVRTFGVERPMLVNPAVVDTAHALAQYIVAEPPDTVTRLFHPEFLSAVPPEEVTDVLAQLFRRYGPCEGVEIVGADHAFRARAAFRFAGGREKVFEIEIDGGDPARIVYLLSL